MSKGDVKKRVRKHLLTYHDALNDRSEKFPHIKEYIPDFLLGEKEIEVFLAVNGLVVAEYPSGFMRFRFQDRADQDIWRIASNIDENIDLNEKSGHKVDLVFGKFQKKDQFGNITFNKEESVWDRLVVTNFTGEDRWSEDIAKQQAHSMTDTVLAGNLINITNIQSIDSPSKINDKQDEVLSHLNSQFSELIDLLNEQPAEKKMQKFFEKEKNKVLLYPQAKEIDPKIALGSEYETDFVIDRGRDQYILVELESPKKKLFTKSGDPRSELTHAKRQVIDWLEWVKENLSYARNKLPNIKNPEALVFIGRDDELSQKDDSRLKQMNAESPNITIQTYDKLLRHNRRLINRLESTLGSQY